MRKALDPAAESALPNVHIRPKASANPADARVRNVQGEPISDADADQLLRALPPLPADAAALGFAARPKSRPLPKDSREVQQPFPEPREAAPPKVAPSVPLEVLRITPEGEVPEAAELSITFNQPVVPLGSHADLASTAPQVLLTPRPSGRFRWLGSQTLVFTPDARFPMASTFQVEVPAGFRSASGAVLAKTVRKTFSTPAPRLVAREPDLDASKLGLAQSPVLAVRFDQAVDAGAVRAQAQFCAGSTCVVARAATEAELRADPRAAELLAQAEAESAAHHALALVPVSPLPVDSAAELRLGQVRSAEGPRTANASTTLPFRTHGRLKVLRRECNQQKPCAPGTPFRIDFNNPLDPKTLAAEDLKLSPEARIVQMAPCWSAEGENFGLSIEVESRARTAYTLTLPAALRDIYGQALTGDSTLGFAVGDPEPLLESVPPVVLLTPDMPSSLHVRTEGISALVASVYRVLPEDFSAFVNILEHMGAAAPTDLPGTKLYTKTLQVATPHLPARHEIDLSEAIPGSAGHAIVVVAPIGSPSEWQPRVVTWVQKTGLGVDVLAGTDALHAWATDLRTAKPLEGVGVSLTGGERPGAVTDASGIARIAYEAKAPQDLRRELIARRGEDSAILPSRLWGLGQYARWVRTPWEAQKYWYTFDDRGLYRPGEPAHIKGFLRRRDKSATSALLMPVEKRVRFQVVSDQGKVYAEGASELSAQGGFHIGFTLPRDAELGYAMLRVSTQTHDDWEHVHALRVAEFRRPEYEVQLSAQAAVQLRSEPIAIDLRANYFTGAPLAFATTHLDASVRAAHFAPPHRGDFSFGEPIRFWRGFHRPDGGAGPGMPARLDTRTDADGRVSFALLVEEPARHLPLSVSVHGNVEDVNRQAWSASKEVLVHPGLAYVGLRKTEPLSEVDRELSVELVSVDHEGRDVPGLDVEAQLVQLAETTSRGVSTRNVVDSHRCTFKSTGNPQRCAFTPKYAGSYKLLARIYDAEGRPSDSELDIWVSGPGKQSRPMSEQSVELIADRESYAPGTTAKLVLRSPMWPAQAWLAFSRDHVRESRVLEITSEHTLIELPMQAADAPTLHVSASVAGFLPDPNDLARLLPSAAHGSVALHIEREAQRLKLTAAPAHAVVEPGAEVSIALTAHDAKGAPVSSAELAVAVVDEAVLGLTGYAPGDPLAVFYPEIARQLEEQHLRGLLRNDAGPETHAAREEQRLLQMAMRHSAIVAGGAVQEGTIGLGSTRTIGRGAQPQSDGTLRQKSMQASRTGDAAAPSLRTLFSPLAHFAARMMTDGMGQATLRFKLKDDLTRYRVFVVGADTSMRFGQAEATLTAQKSLMLRPSAPRFLSFGDSAELPVVIENTADSPAEVRLGARATHVAFTAGRGRTLTVPAHDRVEVRLPIHASAPGSAVFQLVAQSDAAADAAQIGLPIWTPATDEAFTGYASAATDTLLAQPILLPHDVFAEVGGLELSTSATQLSSLTDALRYLLSYPYQCTEQRASRMLGLLALREVLASLHATGVPAPDEAEALLRADVAQLLATQNADGSFPTWEKGREGQAFHTLHVRHALLRAKLAGESGLLDAILRAKEAQERLFSKAEAQYGKATLRSLRAYALYVDSLERAVTSEVAALVGSAPLSGLASEDLGFLLTALGRHAQTHPLVARLRTELERRSSETAGMAQIQSQNSGVRHVLLHTDGRTNALALEALLTVDAEHTLVPKLAKGLLFARKSGHWGNTVADAFAALALRSYFDHYELETPAFESRIFLGSTLAQEAHLVGRSAAQLNTQVPMAELLSRPGEGLLVERKGQGRAYYRWSLHYAPRSLSLLPEDQGFTVERSYQGLDADDDMHIDAAGVLHVKAGARVRITISLVTSAQRYHVALVDPFAAGFEPIQAGLRTSDAPAPPAPRLGAMGRLWQPTWYDHEQLRDERAEAFTQLLPAGVYQYSYDVRATTPGEFTAAPAKAEEMYTPETFGRSGTQRVIVHPRDGA
jgi:uncharacterized protein YfaS (alpha-2-macroglobulin family)